ncbi:MAG: AAA family ATPase [Candidatus Andersenbacteria bacterium RIFCSPHIGHO2_12_FULL_45_11b]|uniref:AAA family ATPase n=1 Tax=Candidatus Andersenbacteria bacterium RIFCSPHIGHO2_12_FULL_45_11b TaxID=1797282 RepID=A0A1G1X6K4_9BACT|nr:MAG: AAA family ATPase [Candidatus Andersenbacteria bacterium RIFCSPHIGHO2_12_FULL_45_11b]
MIVYQSTKSGFLSDVLAGQVEKQILTSFVRELGHSTGKSELASWRNSMPYMSNVVNDPAIPDDAGIAIEYKIPRTSKRIDFIISGMNENNRGVAVLVELKQWQAASLTELDGVVATFVGGGTRDVSHPSYQVWAYATLLEDYNSNVQSNNISIIPCAYLHNYEQDDVITNDFYKEYTEKAPVFLKSDALKLQNFIKQFVRYGDKGDVLYAIEDGRIKPSKALADNLASMLEGNKEFILIDEQKLVYETALKLAKESTPTNKNVLIVEGGPGTGKSVVAINLLTELTNRQTVTQYVTKNSAPREVYQVKLTGKMTKTRISNLFSSSGSFHNIDANTFDSLIVDEAHRLNEKSGMFSNLGENQIKELINAAKFSIFFIDEDQRVALKDIGRKSAIEDWAEKLGASVNTMELASQFRCNGSDGYLAWLDNALQIKETANDSLEDIEYDFQVLDSPQEVHNQIILKNTDNKARIVAGYCWNWVSKKNPDLKDIIIGDYAASWNLNSHGQAWIVHPDSVKEVGCIHTCQGLELDYVGVIIGPDLIVRNGEVITDATKRASTDQSLKGLKAKMKSDPEGARIIADRIIKNTYRTLMTRGMKGCYIYCTDPETQEYFKNQLKRGNKQNNYKATDGGSLTVDR